MTSTRVEDDVGAVQSMCDVRRGAREQLLTQLDAQDRIGRLQEGIADGHMRLPGRFANDIWQIVRFCLADARPWREEAHFAVVAIIGEPDFRADVQDAPMHHRDAAVVQDGAVRHWHADVTEDPVCEIGLQDLGEDLP